MVVETKKISKIEKLTNTNYLDEMIIVGDKGYIDCETLFAIIDDLLIEYSNLEEKKNEEITNLKWVIEEMHDHGIY